MILAVFIVDLIVLRLICPKFFYTFNFLTIIVDPADLVE